MKKTTRETIYDSLVILLAAGLVVINRFKYPTHDFTFSLGVSLGTFTLGLAVVFIYNRLTKAKSGVTKTLLAALFLAILQSLFIL